MEAIIVAIMQDYVLCCSCWYLHIIVFVVAKIISIHIFVDSVFVQHNNIKMGYTYDFVGGISS